MKRLLATSLVLISAAAVVACGSESDEGGSSEATVSATTGIVADIASQVAGGDAEVVQVIPDSASPHDFSLSASDRADIEDSALLVSNGADLETGIPFDEIDVPSYALAEHAGELLPFAEEGEQHEPEGDGHEAEEEHAGEEEEHEHSGSDPHLWMDPSRVAAAVPSLADALAEADPEHAEGYRERGAAYAEQLEQLDRELRTTLAAIPEQNRELVTSHDALGYLADRYDLAVVATPFPSSGPESEASARAISEVEAAISELGVPAVFAEETDDPQVLEQIAERTGVEVVDGLLVETPGGAGSYAEMLRIDADLIAAALGAGPAGS